MAHRAEIEALQQRELLQKDRALRPWPALEDGCAAVGAADRLFDPGRERGEILERQQSAVSVRVRDDLARDVAAVKALDRRMQSGLAPALARAGFGLEQAAEKIR